MRKHTNILELFKTDFPKINTLGFIPKGRTKSGLLAMFSPFACFFENDLVVPNIELNIFQKTMKSHGIFDYVFVEAVVGDTVNKAERVVGELHMKIVVEDKRMVVDRNRIIVERIGLLPKKLHGDIKFELSNKQPTFISYYDSEIKSVLSNLEYEHLWESDANSKKHNEFGYCDYKSKREIWERLRSFERKYFKI